MGRRPHPRRAGGPRPSARRTRTRSHGRSAPGARGAPPAAPRSGGLRSRRCGNPWAPPAGRLRRRERYTAAASAVQRARSQALVSDATRRHRCVHDVHAAARAVRHPLPGPAAAGPPARRGHGQVPSGHPRPGRDPAPPVSGRPPQINSRGISVRLEAIDALETHFDETHQELAGANARAGRAARPARVHRRRRSSPTARTTSSLGRPGLAPRPCAVQRHRRQRPDDRVRLPGRPGRTRRRAGVPGQPAGRPLDQRHPAHRGTRLPGVLRHPAGGPARPPRGRVRGRPAPPALGIWPRSTADPNGAATIPDLAGRWRSW